MLLSSQKCVRDPATDLQHFLHFLFLAIYFTEACDVYDGRMLVVLEVEKAGSDYDKILDILFLSVGLLNPSGMVKYSSPHTLRKSVKLKLEMSH